MMSLLTPLNVNCHASDGRKVFLFKTDLKVVISYMIQLLFDQILKILNIKSTFFTVCGKIRFHLSSSQLRGWFLFFNLKRTMQVILYRINKLLS